MLCATQLCELKHTVIPTFSSSSSSPDVAMPPHEPHEVGIWKYAWLDLGRAFGKRKDASDGGGAGGLDETIAFDRWHVERSWNARGTLVERSWSARGTLVERSQKLRGLHF